MPMSLVKDVVWLYIYSNGGTAWTILESAEEQSARLTFSSKSGKVKVLTEVEIIIQNLWYLALV